MSRPVTFVDRPSTSGPVSAANLNLATTRLVLNVKDYGAVGNGVADDTSAIQTALNVAGVVYFPAGQYIISSALTLSSNTILLGAGSASILTLTSATAHCLSGSALSGIAIRDMYIQGPVSSGTGDGLHLVKGANAAVPYIALENVTFTQFNDGVSIENAIVSSFQGVRTVSNRRYGFNLFGQVAGAAGTSCAFAACFANANTTAGYRIYNMTYTSFSGCAADANPIGYLIDTCQGMSLAGCGAESNTTNGFKITGSVGVTLSGCWVYDNRSVGVYVTGSSNAATLNVTDNSPNGSATNFIKTDSGSYSTLMACVNVTANSLASSTTTVIPAGAGPTFANYVSILAGGEASGNWTLYGGSIIAASAGQGVQVKEGTNAKMGVTGAMTAGAITVSTTAVTATSRIFLTAQTTGGTAGALRVSARTAGTSFTITSTSGSDTSTVAWFIVEPAP